MTLLEEVCHWGWVLRFQKLTPDPVSCLSVDQDAALRYCGSLNVIGPHNPKGSGTVMGLALLK